MNKNDIVITIAGQPKSGKSRIAYIVKEMLKVYNLNIDFDPTPDFLNEQDFNKHMRTDIETIANKVNGTIIIREQQLHI